MCQPGLSRNQVRKTPYHCNSKCDIIAPRLSKQPQADVETQRNHDEDEGQEDDGACDKTVYDVFIGVRRGISGHGEVDDAAVVPDGSKIGHP